MRSGWDTSKWDGEMKESEANKTTHEKLRGDDALRRGGGEDTYRAEMRNVIERKIMDHDKSGYNLQTAPVMKAEEASWKASQEGRVADKGTIEPNGIFKY